MKEMKEVQSTKGIERNMHSEIENLVRKAYNEGFDDGKKAVTTMDSCSWEKGVTDAWDCVTHTLGLMSKDGDFTELEKRVLKAVALILAESRPVEQTRCYVKTKNGETDKDELEVGDVVYDPMNNECIITNIGTHIHVLYPKNGKTHKWKLETEFEPTGRHVIGVGKIEL